MILQPNFSLVSQTSLEKKRSNLIQAEPYTEHSITTCWNSQCPSCNRWRKWAKDIEALTLEINNKKA